MTAVWLFAIGTAVEAGLAEQVVGSREEGTGQLQEAWEDKHLLENTPTLPG